MNVGIVDGHVHLHADAGVKFNDPNPDGKITATELRDTPLADLVTLTPIVDLDANLPVFADPFQMGGLTVSMAGLVAVTESSADFSMTADIAGTLIPGVEILAPSRVQFDDDTGFTIDAAARAFGADVHLTGEIVPSGAFELLATADDVPSAR